MLGGDGDQADDPSRAAARARLAARAAHVEGGMAAQAAAEAAVEAVSGPNDDGANDENAGAIPGGGATRRSVFSRLQRGTPSQLALGDTTNAMKTPGAGPLHGGGAAAKRKHLLSPPLKVARRKGHTGAGINVARAARDLCGDLGEPKENLMRRAIETIGVVVANDLAIEVGTRRRAASRRPTQRTTDPFRAFSIWAAAVRTARTRRARGRDGFSTL